MILTSPKFYKNSKKCEKNFFTILTSPKFYKNFRREQRQSTQSWKKKWSHFDLKTRVTGGTKIRHGIPSNWTIFESNWLDIGIELELTHHIESIWFNFLGQNDTIFFFQWNSSAHPRDKGRIHLPAGASHAIEELKNFLYIYFFFFNLIFFYLISNSLCWWKIRGDELPCMQIWFLERLALYAGAFLPSIWYCMLQ